MPVTGIGIDRRDNPFRRNTLTDPRRRPVAMINDFDVLGRDDPQQRDVSREFVIDDTRAAVDDHCCVTEQLIDQLAARCRR